MRALELLAEIHRKHHNTESPVWIGPEDLRAIEEAVESAEKELEFPVSVKRLRDGLPIATDKP